jgi:dATP pyrophosphohydrolase
VPAFKRPESVLVVVHAGGQVLLLERRAPAGWWQSVTGSLEPGESSAEAALRELGEETGLPADGLVDLRLSARFPILPAWRERYPPGADTNLEHAFALPLPAPRAIEPSPEHVTAAWLPLAEALVRASSWSDRQAIRTACGSG